MGSPEDSPRKPTNNGKNIRTAWGKSRENAKILERKLRKRKIFLKFAANSKKRGGKYWKIRGKNRKIRDKYRKILENPRQILENIGKSATNIEKYWKILENTGRYWKDYWKNIGKYRKSWRALKIKNRKNSIAINEFVAMPNVADAPYPR